MRLLAGFNLPVIRSFIVDSSWEAKELAVSKSSLRSAMFAAEFIRRGKQNQKRKPGEKKEKRQIGKKDKTRTAQAVFGTKPMAHRPDGVPVQGQSPHIGHKKPTAHRAITASSARLMKLPTPRRQRAPPLRAVPTEARTHRVPRDVRERSEHPRRGSHMTRRRSAPNGPTHPTYDRSSLPCPYAVTSHEASAARCTPRDTGLLASSRLVSSPGVAARWRGTDWVLIWLRSIAFGVSADLTDRPRGAYFWMDTQQVLSRARRGCEPPWLSMCRVPHARGRSEVSGWDVDS